MAAGEAGSGDLEAMRLFVEQFSMVLYERGLPRMPARVFTWLLCSESETVTARELTEMLGVSPAAVSSAVGYLNEAGLIVRRPVPGSRQDHYGLPPEGTLGALMRRSERAPDLAGLAAQGMALLGPGSPGGLRLNEIAEFTAFMDAEMKGVWERWQNRAARSAPRD